MQIFSSVCVYLNGNRAFSDVEVVAADGLGGVPLALPVELAGEVPPEGGRVLDGLLVHLLILHGNRIPQLSLTWSNYHESPGS